MVSIEDKLKQYRQSKEVSTPRFLGFFDKKRNADEALEKQVLLSEENEESDILLQGDICSDQEFPLDNLDGHVSQCPSPVNLESSVKSPYDRTLYYVALILKVSLWAILMTLFVKLQFGAVFFVISAFYFIYANLRSRPKLEGEPSAYSVFNPNCESIEGTLKAEHLERQLLFQH